MSEVQVLVNQDVPRSVDEGVWTGLKGTKRGEICIIDFYTQMVIEENAYQIRAGTVTTAITGDEAITDTKAEMAVAALAKTTIMPCEVWITLNNMGGDSVEQAAKSVGASTMTGGTAFEPLNLFIGGKAPITKGMVGTAGGVVVAAEVDTTTRQHFHATQEFANDSGAERTQTSHYHYPTSKTSGTGVNCNPLIWHPAILPILAGAACFYVQIASATTAPGYFAHIDYIELPTTSVT